MANTIKYISLDNLAAYTALINSKISTGDAVAIKAVEIDGETIKFYNEIPTSTSTPSFEIELPKTDFTEINKKLDTLIGNDQDKTVRLIAAEEIAAQLIPDDAKESLDTLKEIAEWIQNHPDDASKMAADIESIKTLIGTLPSDATATDIISYIQDVVVTESTRAVNAENKLNSAIEAVSKDYLKASDKTDLEAKITANTTAIDTKADKTDVANIASDLSDLSDVVDTKVSKSDLDETNMDVFNNTSAIEKINKTLLTKADQTSLDDVNSSLTESIANTNANVSANTSAIATKAAQTDLNATNTNVANLDTRVTTNTNNIYNNTSEITNLKGRVSTSETEIQSNAANITALKGDVDDITADVANIQKTLDSNLGNITGLASRITVNETNIATNAENITELQNTVSTKASQDDLSALETKVNGAIIDNITALETKVTANTEAIDTKASQDNLDALAARMTTNETNIETIESDVTTLIGADTGKSARTIASEELAKELIPDNAKDALDTIAEIAQWIQDHPDDAAAMNEAIKALQTKLSTDEDTLNGTIKNVTISGRTITVTFVNGATKTLTTQDTDTTYDVVTTTSNGLMSMADKIKLNDIAEGANKTVVDTALSSTSTNPVQNKAVNTAIVAKADKATTLSGYGISDAYTKSQVDANTVKSVSLSGKVITVTMGDNTTKTLTIPDTTYNAATTSTAGLMSAADKTKLDGIASGATKIMVDSSLSSTSTNPIQNKAVNTALSAKANVADTVKSLSISGKTITVTNGDGTTSTLITQDTTYTLPTATATTLGGVKVDTALSASSTNPVQNKAINTALATKVNTADVTSTYSADGTAPVNGKAVAEALETAKGDPNVLPTLWGKEYLGSRETVLTRDADGLVTKMTETTDNGTAESTITYTDGEISKISTSGTDATGNYAKITEYTRTDGNITTVKETFGRPEDPSNPSWATIAAQVKSGAASALYNVGDTFTDDWTYNNNGTKTTYSAPWRIMDFQDATLEDGSTVKAMQLMFEYLTPFSMSFHRPEAFYAATDGLSAGTYNYTYSGTTYQFTLTKDVEAGGRLAYSSSTGSASTSTIVSYMSDGKTVIESVSRSTGSEGTALGTIENYTQGDNFNGQYLAQYGNGRYRDSHVRQWLNSSAGPNEWWTPVNKWDIVPYSSYYNKAGFLNGLPQDLIDAMLPTKIITYPATVYGSDPDIIYDKVTLPSLVQMYINPQKSGEGESFQYYKDLNGTSTMYQRNSTYPALKKYKIDNRSSSSHYWTRSVSASGANYAWYVYSDGYVHYYGAYIDFCLAGLANIGHL